MADIPGKKGPATHKQMLKEINKSLQHQISNRADQNSVKNYGIANLSAVEQLSLQNLASALPGDRRSFPTRSTKNALEEIRSYLQQFRCDGDPDSASSSSPIVGTSISYDRNNSASSFLKSSSVTDLNILHQDMQDVPIDNFQRELSHAYLASNDRDQPVFSYKTDETLNLEAVANGHVPNMPNRKLSSKTTACAVSAPRSQIFPQQPSVHHLPASGAHNQLFQRPVKGHEGNITQAQRIFGVNPVAPRPHQSSFSPALVSSMTPSNRFPMSFAQLPKKNSQENSSSSPSAIGIAKRIPVNVLALERNDRPRSAVFNNDVPSNQTVQASLITDIKNGQRPRSDIFPASEDEGDVRAVSHSSDHQCARCDVVQGNHPASSHKAPDQYGLRQSPWEGVVMRRKSQEPKKVQDRWSAEILNQGAGRGSLNYLDKRTSIEAIPSKPPPPYPGVSVSKSAALQPSNPSHISGQSAVERDCILCSDGSNPSFSYASTSNDNAINESTKGGSAPNAHGNISACLFEARSHQGNDLDGRALSLLDIRSPTTSSQCSSGYPLKHWDPPPYDISAQKQLLLKSVPDRQFMPVESAACIDNVNMRYIEDSTLGRISGIVLDEEKESSCSGLLEENVFTSQLIAMDPSNSLSVDDQISSFSETHASDLLSATDGVERSYSPLPTSGSPCATMVIHPESLREEKLKQFSAEGREPLSGRLKNYTPQAYKFYMEQHVENLLKQQDQRIKRQRQLEVEMARVGLSSEAQEEMRKMLYKKESNYIRLRRAKMDKSMFSKVKTIGIGAFGEVSLVRKFDTKALYAMKTLRKSEVIRRNQVAHVKAERDILAEADNEWVVKLYYSFQDDHNLYFVMDYVPGGDLMALLIKLGIFDAVLAKFYVSELVLAIESVHKLGFIHRDIKPDNVLIGRDGHIKLTDFGLCTGFRWTHDSKYYQSEGEAGHSRQFSMEPDGGWEAMLSEVDCDCSSVRIKHDLCKPLERRAARRHMRCTAHSLVGTPNYIAPEVLMRIPYSQLCDWWSVGVILYEMLVGMPPFVAPTPAETQLKVINWRQTLNIPRGRLHPDAADLIRQLCTAPEDRIGQKGATEIKSHSYFDHVNFLTIHQEVAPYIPRIKHATDTSNFDPVPDKMATGSDTDSGFQEKEEMKGEFAFFGFTFRHFFDDGGHANPFVDTPVDEALETHSRPLHVEGAQSGNKRPAASSQKSITTPSKVSAPNVPVSNEEKLPIYV